MSRDPSEAHGAYRETPAIPEGRIVRLCRSHRAELIERNGALWCPLAPGHYPHDWAVVDRAKPGQETIAGPDDLSVREVESWRVGIRKLPDRPRPGGRPPSSPATRSMPKPGPLEAVAETEDRPDVAATTRGGQGGTMRKCSVCGAPGHDRRNCRGRTAAAPPPRESAPAVGRSGPAPARPSIALALTDQSPDLEKLRDRLERDLQELNRALLTFDLIESRIPKRHVVLARQLLVEAGVSREATEGRQSIALAKLVAGVAAALFAASTVRWGRRKQDLLAAAAEAIVGRRGVASRRLQKKSRKRRGE